MDFIAVDFETANPNYASVCAAGWATVRDGFIVDSGSWLCRPTIGLGVPPKKWTRLTCFRGGSQRALVVDR